MPASDPGHLAEWRGQYGAGGLAGHEHASLLAQRIKCDAVRPVRDSETEDGLAFVHLIQRCINRIFRANSSSCGEKVMTILGRLAFLKGNSLTAHSDFANAAALT